MLVANLIGGLGNQMFQYASAWALASEHGMELKLDISDFHRFPPRRYLLDHFRVDALIARPDELALFDKDSNRLRAGTRKFVARLRGINRVTGRTIFERGFPWQKVPLDRSVDTLLIGYWQSERYFLPLANQVRHVFTLKLPPDDPTQRLLEDIDRHSAVSLHVRRGDYASNPVVQAKHGLLGLDYYAAAIAHILTFEPNAKFYVFSDDMNWVRASLPIAAPVEYVDLNGPDEPHEDLRLMSRCRHHIIANSSLSWWGAWLNPSPGKVVIAPRQWFTPESRRDARDIVPPGWVRL
jgi:Glycosyl transferase family 11